ncbi:glycosyltransferase family 1 protein [Candidatus Parcubacteria bacterium]|jgi:phosphatidylinositol alpha-1,6-mannosyltransferase|nr:MAG: glycosyltransferase family 1 protein [Candidatus Parcubacteria bacterium]
MKAGHIPKILLLVQRFPPSYTGGVPNYYHNLMGNINNAEVHLLTQMSNAEIDSKCDQEISKRGNCFVKRLSSFPDNMQLQLSFKWLSSLMQMIRAQIRYIKENNIEIIVVGQVRMFLLLAAFIAGFITRKPYVLFFHGEEIPQIPMKSNGLLRWLYKRAEGYFCNSGFTADRLRRFTKLKNISPFIVNPGVEDRFFEKPRNINSIIERLSIRGKKILYTIGRLDERKGHDMVIRALPAVIEKYPDILYLIGGKGPMLKKLEKLVADMSLQAYVRFLGFVPDDEIVAYHYLGDIFIMPNRILNNGDSEGFGIVFLEANAAGTPVIGGQEGGSVDAVIDGVTGLWVNPRNKNDIAEKIGFLLDNEEIKDEIGKAGRKRCWEKFRWPYLAARFDSALLVLCQKQE